MSRKRYAEEGATALIVVVFSILLLVTVSVGFMRLVVKDQGRTNDDELSRGAYDSAIAGIEDGKRVLQACLANGDAAACAALNDPDKPCNTIHAAKILSDSDDDTNTSPVLLQNSAGVTGGFDQAYTCVKIDRNTDDYTATITADTSQVIPLQTTGSFTDVVVSWFIKSNPTASVNLASPTATQLPPKAGWSSVATEVRPPLLRVQLIQYNKGSFTLSDFDKDRGGHTLYLYPTNSTIANYLFTADGRRSGGATLIKPAQCSTAAITGYVCTATLTLPDPVGGSAPTRAAYLRVTSIYGDTDVNIRAVGTQFQDVEPSIDSTGRASDVYRRIKARVQLTSSIDTQLFPRATVDITNNFCKNFSVTPSAYTAGLNCTP